MNDTARLIWTIRLVGDFWCALVFLNFALAEIAYRVGFASDKPVASWKGPVVPVIQTVLFAFWVFSIRACITAAIPAP